jgi:hypothetical protein
MDNRIDSLRSAELQHSHAARGNEKKYTGHLLKAMRNGGGWLIEKVFREANTAVVTLSKKQEPWTEGNLIGGDFCLAGCGE